MPALDLIVSCEHGGNRIPARYGALFRKADAVLESHRGFDAGALHAAHVLSRAFGAPLVASTTSRLLVDLNRSEGNPRVFSEFTRGVPSPEKEVLLERHHRPYRREVEEAVRARIQRGGTVLHLSVHSFTPVLSGSVRYADVGLLYDPSRSIEARLCRLWQEAVLRADPSLHVRRNHPYLGKSDGLTTHLRGVFPVRRYLGVELEIGQRLLSRGRFPSKLLDLLARTLQERLATGRMYNPRSRNDHG